MFGILGSLAERSPTFSKACVALATPHLTEKLGDMKLKKSAGDTLALFAEKTSLSFVLNLGMLEFIIMPESSLIVAYDIF